jgi:hypothetical protein
MSFSPTGKIARSRKKISIQNDGRAHGARQFSALSRLFDTRKWKRGLITNILK